MNDKTILVKFRSKNRFTGETREFTEEHRNLNDAKLRACALGWGIISHEPIQSSPKGADGILDRHA